MQTDWAYKSYDSKFNSRDEPILELWIIVYSPLLKYAWIWKYGQFIEFNYRNL
jgi:hypothetical protein